MKREIWIIALMVCTLLGTGLAARAQAQVDLEAPFKLTEGQSAQVSDGFQVTLRTVSDDSGCMTPDDCSTMMFKGTLVLRSGEESQLGEFDVSFYAGKPFTTDFGAHTVEISAVRRLAKDHIEVTFKVLPAAEPEPEPDPDPE
jgi:hypothetical protein